MREEERRERLRGRGVETERGGLVAAKVALRVEAGVGKMVVVRVEVECC